MAKMSLVWLFMMVLNIFIHIQAIRWCSRRGGLTSDWRQCRTIKIPREPALLTLVRRRRDDWLTDFGGLAEPFCG
jgi:hypothetical protein